MVLVIAIVAVVFTLLPNSETWLPDDFTAFGHGFTGAITTVLNTLLNVSVKVPEWIYILLSCGSMALLMIMLGNKIGKIDSKNKIALYILSGVFVVLAFASMGVSMTGDDYNSDISDGAEAFAAIVAILMMAVFMIALCALMIFIGVRFMSYGSKKYKTFGTYFIVYVVADILVVILEACMPDYSVGAKIMSLLENALDCGLIYFLTASLIPLGKKNPLKYVIGYGLIIIAFMVLIFAIDMAYSGDDDYGEMPAATDSVDSVDADTAGFGVDDGSYDDDDEYTSPDTSLDDEYE